MLTFFTTAKAFRGHDGIIQRNALKSWKLLDPDVEVILFGDDDGAAEVCTELGLRHEPRVERHESGTKRLHYIFLRAQEISRHEYCCFANCDIILMQDFREAFEKARAWKKQFLLVAQRWDTDITEPIDFGDREWSDKLRRSAQTSGIQQDEFWIDIFLFRKGQYLEMPPLLVGHCYWDTWMIWKALHSGIPVLDGTPAVMPIHQNHSYNPTFGREKGTNTDALSKYNLQLIGGEQNIRHMQYSTHRLGSRGHIYPNLYRYVLVPVRIWWPRIKNFFAYKVWLPVWHTLLDITRPVRKVFGLRSKRLREGEER
jgi:hypothetical protein